jgi:deoxyribodipyrimidine photo-lyase
MKKINIFWFRRDLRLNDNNALFQATNSGLPVLPLFIFDNNITEELPANDPRLSFIYETLYSINDKLNEYGSSVLILKGNPESLWEELLKSYDINTVFFNKDYEPYAIQRDKAIEALLNKQGIAFQKFKDQVIFEENEILKSNNKPYTVFTPYKNSWLKNLERKLPLRISDSINIKQFYPEIFNFPSPARMGIGISRLKVRKPDLNAIKEYHKFRYFPALDATTYLGPHLRFGTISIRRIVNLALQDNQVFLNELIWMEFFMQILYHFPHVVTGNFKSKFYNIQWRNNEAEFEKWCMGETGYPIVDAGMRQLNETGFMHNRVRMITAGFLCKHLLIDWRWGEAYFAQTGNGLQEQVVMPHHTSEYLTRVCNRKNLIRNLNTYGNGCKILISPLILNQLLSMILQGSGQFQLINQG